MSSEVGPRLRRIAGGAGLLALYLGLAVWLTWPLGAYLSTHLPGGWPGWFDDVYAAWALSQESRALVSHPTHFADANIYFPARHALFYGPTGLGALPYFIGPFLATGNPLLAMNVTYILSVALTALALHVVVRRWTGSHPAGFVSGWTFLTTPWVLWGFPPTAPSYAVLQYFPLVIFWAAQPVTVGVAARLIPLIVLQGLTGLYFVPAVLAPLGAIALGRLARRQSRRAGLALLGVLALSLPFIGAAYLGHVLVRWENPRLRWQTYWPGLPTEWAGLFPHGFFSLFSPPAATAVPVAALLIAAAGAGCRAVRSPAGGAPPPRAAWIHGAVWAGVGLFISQLPVVHGGSSVLAWPLAMLARIVPVYETIRVPGRLGVAGLMGFALLAGVGFAEVALRLRRGRLRTDLLLLALASIAMLWDGGVTAFPSSFRLATLAGSYPIWEPPTAPPKIMTALATPGGPLVELPARPDVYFHAACMYRSIFHRRPILNGYGSYWPAGFPERMALADQLPDPAALGALRRETGLDMILVHLDRIDKEARLRWFQLATRVRRLPGLRLVAWTPGAMVFAVDDAAASASAPGP